MDFKEVKLADIFKGTARCHGHCIATVKAFYESGLEAAEVDWQKHGTCKAAKIQQSSLIGAINRLGLRNAIGTKLRENEIYLYRKDLVAK